MMEGDRGALAVNPVSLIPKEIWEIILEKVEDTQGILSILEVFPDLTSLSTTPAFSWKIAQILPLLLPKYFKFSDILNLRLVSKRWYNAVSKSLLEHPDKCPSSGGIVTPTHFNYQQLPPFFTDFTRFKAGLVGLPWNDAMPFWNPFLGRTLKISATSAFEIRGFHVPAVTLSAAVSILKCFGRQVFFVTLDLGRFAEDTLPEVVPQLCLVLHFLPNLQTLKICGEVVHYFAQPYGTIQHLFPDNLQLPPNLESLDLSEFLDRQNFVLRDLENYFQFQCRPKHVAVLVSQRTSVARNFPNLSSLQLSLFRDSHSWGLDTLSNLLHSFSDNVGLQRFSNLQKLALHHWNNWGTLDLNQILNYLEPLHLEILEYSDRTLEHDGQEPTLQEGVYGPYPTLQTLKQLTICDTLAVNYDFLQRLPSLQYLTVCAHRPYDTAPLDTPCFTKTVATYLYGRQGPVEGSLWRELPSLKMLTVVSRPGKILHQYVRECGNKMFSGPRYLSPLLPPANNEGDVGGNGRDPLFAVLRMMNLLEVPRDFEEGMEVILGRRGEHEEPVNF